MSTYVYDQAWERERDRLRGLEKWMDPGSIRHLEALGVTAGWRCLEIGGGAGSMALWLAERVAPDGQVLVTDLDTRFLDVLEHPNLQVQRHDITADPLPKDHFDLIHTRFLLEHLPAHEQVIARCVEALKPGGWFVAEDIDTASHVPVTPSEAYEKVEAAIAAVMARAGADLSFGRRLPGLLARAGLADVAAAGRIEIGSREDNPGVDMYKLSIVQLKDALVSSGAVTADEIDETLRLLDDPTFEVLPPSVIAAWGRKP